MMMKSVSWWRKPEYPEETTDLRQLTQRGKVISGLCPTEKYNDHVLFCIKKSVNDDGNFVCLHGCLYKEPLIKSKKDDGLSRSKHK